MKSRDVDLALELLYKFWSRSEMYGDLIHNPQPALKALCPHRLMSN